MHLIMDSKERKKIREKLKAKNKEYLSTIDCKIKKSLNFDKRFDKLRCEIVSILRKDRNSENGYKQLKNTTSVLFGIHEDIKHQKIDECNFEIEKSIINDYLKDYIENQISTNYNSEVSSFGESLLCGYIDCFLNASKIEIEKDYGINPSFLINPRTSKLMEIDVALKDYRLYFEFQGHPSHYDDDKTISKDEDKLELCFSKNIVLVPINISQLNAQDLITVIINTMKDFLGIKKVIIGDFSETELYEDLTKNQLLGYSRLTQKIYLSTVILEDTLKYLDERASIWVNKMIIKNPNGYSQNHDAPRFINENDDYSISKIYYGLKNVTKLRKTGYNKR